MFKLGNEFFNNPKIGLKSIEHIKGIDSFKKSLEKHFFAEVAIGNYSSKKEAANLTINIKANFSLEESLFHLNKIEPDITCVKEDKPEKTFMFHRAFAKLKKQNTISIDISELTISLTDTTILISKIYKQSIVEQAENIFQELVKHYPFYSKGTSETPFEMFIPVYEEDTLENDHMLPSFISNNNDTNDYFGFWGIYYYRTEQASIYDLYSKRVIRGDIQILEEE